MGEMECDGERSRCVGLLCCFLLEKGVSEGREMVEMMMCECCPCCVDDGCLGD